MSSGAAAGEDTRIWVGRVASDRHTEHTRFVEWLNGSEAQSIFRRRRLTAYRLTEQDGLVTVVFKAPHTGDPRLMIDFLRYPGMWPDFWEFVRGGRGEDFAPDLDASAASAPSVHWGRPADGADGAAKDHQPC